MTELETVPFTEPTNPYLHISDWLKHRETLWNQLLASTDPYEMRTLLHTLSKDTDRFNEETRRLRG